MMASVIIGGLIFGYAAFTLYRFVKRSRLGKCAGCSVSNSCAACTEPAEMERQAKVARKDSVSRI